MSRVWEIWSEGYRVTGNESGAFVLGSAAADTFEHAIESWISSDPERAKHISKSPSGIYSYWGCRLFENETDARASFGE